MKSSEKKYFPMFVDLTDKKVVVAGAGTIAKRRIRAMLEFTEHLTVIAPEVNPELRTLEEQGKLTVLRKAYEREDLYDAALVIAALAAEGVTRIRGCSFIERGYEHICEDLTALGGLLIKDRGTL